MKEASDDGPLCVLRVSLFTLTYSSLPFIEQIIKYVF